MPSIRKTVDKSGTVTYKVQVTNGRGRKVTRSWRPEPGWSARTTERELHKFAANLENELAEGTVKTRQEDLEEKRLAALEAAKIKTFKQYVNGVYMPTKEIKFSENTRSSYRMNLEKHLFPILGDQLMTEISSAMVKQLLLDFQKNGHAHASVIKLYNILNGIFRMAYGDETIPINPMLRVERPSPSKDEKVIDESEKAYTINELRHILKSLENEPLKWRAYVNLMADTGLRRGECCAVQWRDIDWMRGMVTVRRNVQYTPDKGVYITTPKNGKARTVDVGPEVLTLLRQLREEQSQKAISQWVFTQDGTSDVMHPDTPTRYFKKFGERYGVKDFHPHKLRHTSASLAITNGADVVSVSQRLGHSDTAITLRLYSHANEESIRRAGQTVRDALKAQGE